MPIMGNVSKKVSANKRGKFGPNSADLVAQTSHAVFHGQVSLKGAAQLAPACWAPRLRRAMPLDARRVSPVMGAIPGFRAEPFPLDTITSSNARAERHSGATTQG